MPQFTGVGIDVQWIDGDTDPVTDEWWRVEDTVGGSDKAQDLFGLFDDTLARLLAVPR